MAGPEQSAEGSVRNAASAMRLVIVSGLSGSGKSAALNMLEDLHYYCIDNIPAAMLPRVVPDVVESLDDATIRHLAIGVDARNRSAALESVPRFVRSIREQGYDCDIVFLQTSDDVLLRRYRETRRRHPLARDGVSLRDAIAQEREQLGPLLNAADLIIDTSATGVYELRDIIATRVAERQPRALSILIESFGFKHGIPSDSDFVFDLRCLPNPYWEPALKPLSGLDDPVVRFLDGQEDVETMYRDILSFLLRWIPHYLSFHRAYLTVALGCTGGQHRSVYMVERLAATLRDHHKHVQARHNELR